MAGISAIESGVNFYFLNENYSHRPPISSKMTDQLQRGQEYLQSEMPRYRILPNSHEVTKVHQYGLPCSDHRFTTAEKGDWRVTVVDPRGTFNQAYFTTPPDAARLAEELLPSQRFRKPNPEDPQEQKHTAAQLFLAENTDLLVGNVFCNMGKEPDVMAVPRLLELWNRPDLVLFTPYPLVLEIGLRGKFGKVERYVQEFERVFPTMKGKVNRAVVHYTVNEAGGHLRIFSSSPYHSQDMVA
jgi:hypothetical protein